MSPMEISCELVDEGDLDTRYLAGVLSEEEAEAFESHFFGCERCWDLVKQGLAVRAAYESTAPPAIPDSKPPLLTRQSRSGLRLSSRQWWGLAAAAALALTVVGIRSIGSGRDPNPQGDVFRGRGAVFAVIPGVKARTLTAAWPKLPEADVYRVRLYAPDGTLALERETQDTTLSVPLDSLGTLKPEADVFWQVQAFDALRNRIARSDLTRAARHDSTP